MVHVHGARLFFVEPPPQRWLPDLTAKAIPLREGLDPLQMLTSDSKVSSTLTVPLLRELF